MMQLGLLQFELLIHDAHSLKEKRRVVRSLVDRLSRRYRVSIAEVGLRDVHHAAEIAIAVVAGTARDAAGILDRLIEVIDAEADAQMGEYQRDVIDTDTLRHPFLDDDGTPLWTEQERREESAPEEPGR